MKRPYKVVFTSDEERTEVDVHLTPAALNLLLDIADAVNEQATWSASVRVRVESTDSAAITGGAA